MPATEADLLFREALLACELPVVKSWLLWTGVTLGTRFNLRPWGRIGIMVWFIAALAGTAAHVRRHGGVRWQRSVLIDATGGKCASPGEVSGSAELSAL
jgi:hypothetical protein